MLGWVATASVGYLTKANCNSCQFPCRPALTWKGRPFKLSFCIHNATIDGTILSSGQRPFVTVSVGDRVKKTELADWSNEAGHWSFREIITLEVCPGDEACIAVNCNQQYNLVVAQVALASHCIGETCIPVSKIMPQLRMEDRDIDGLVYTTPSVTFDLLRDGIKVGRGVLSFETKQPPPPQKPLSATDPICNFGS